MKAYDKTHMNLDLVVFELWNEEPFTAINAQKSGINVAEQYWQGSDINSYFQLQSNGVLVAVMRGSDDKKVSLRIFMVLIVKHQKLQLQLLVFAILIF